MYTAVESILQFFAFFIIFYMVFILVIYSVMIIIAFSQIRKQRFINKDFLDDSLVQNYYSKPISIIVPAFNEEVGIIDSIHSLTNLKYPNLEIIVVNDGSTDETLLKIVNHFQMKRIHKVIRQELTTQEVKGLYQSTIQPNLYLMDKENGGKSDSINSGINFSSFPYFCTVDADSILEEHSLLRIMEPLLMSDEEIVGVGGNVKIANGNEFRLGSLLQSNLSNNALVTTQIIEYSRSFLLGRVAMSKLNLLLILSGAFSVFNKAWVLKVNGYSPNMIGEDMEIIVKLHRHFKENGIEKRIEYVPDPVCWTEAPPTLSDLRKQRRRWQQGLIDTLIKHIKVTLNPKYGKVGLLAFPYFWFVECIGPIIEFLGYVYIIISFFLGNLYLEFALLLSSLLILYSVLFSLSSILYESWTTRTYPKTKDLLKLFVSSFLEIFWYKPITLLFRLEGMVRSIFKLRSWGTMKRKGFDHGGTTE